MALQPKQMSSFVNMMLSWLRKCIAVTAVMFFLVTSVRAQQEYFIFLQSEQQQPFYARIGEKIYSSSAAGHLVLPGLKDSTYSVFIGFPKNQHQEMEFVVPVSRKDQGFQLKDMGDQGYHLFNFLTLQLLKPKTVAPKSSAYSHDIKKKTDSYSTLMAGVVNDTAVLYATFAVSPTTSQVPANAVNREPDKNDAAVKSLDTVLAKADKDRPQSVNDTNKETLRDSTFEKVMPPVNTDRTGKTDPVTDSNLVVKLQVRDTVMVKTVTTTEKSSDSTINRKETVSVFRDSAGNVPVAASRPGISNISKLSEYKKADGLQLNYMVSGAAGQVDTVSLLIPYATLPGEVTKTATEKKSDTTTNVQIPEMKNTRDSLTNAGRLVMINSDCRNFASERDVDKLRIRILSEKKDSEKLEVVRKEYRTRCYTSRQIRALSELFYLEPVRFEFLSTSYPFVSDSENFRQLVSLLRDPVYVEKFEGLFKN